MAGRGRPASAPAAARAPLRRPGVGLKAKKGKYMRHKAIPFRVVDIDEAMTPRKLAERMGVRVRQLFGMLMDLGEKVGWWVWVAAGKRARPHLFAPARVCAPVHADVCWRLALWRVRCVPCVPVSSLLLEFPAC